MTRKDDEEITTYLPILGASAQFLPPHAVMITVVDFGD